MKWNNPVRIDSPVDARRLLPLGENYMLFAFGGIVAVNPDTMPDFWDVARFMKSGLDHVRRLKALLLDSAA